MGQSTAYVQRLARELNLPEDAPKVLERSKYWSPEFVHLFCARIRALTFEDPRAAAQAARVGPKLAAKTAFQQRLSADAEAGLRAMTLSLLGNALRAAGSLADARLCFREGFAVISPLGEKIEPAVRVTLYYRYAELLSLLKEPEHALLLTEKALEIASAKCREYLPHVYLVRSYVDFNAGRKAEALLATAQALGHAHPRRDLLTYLVTLQNFSYFLLFGTCGVDVLKVAARSLALAHRLIAGDRRNTMPKLRLYWVSGLLNRRLGAYRAAERNFTLAREGFKELEANIDLALVSLDLAACRWASGDFATIPELLRETEEAFARCCTDEESCQALASLTDAVKKNAEFDDFEDIVLKVRQTLWHRGGFFGPRGGLRTPEGEASR